jgi:hypothetical protein
MRTELNLAITCSKCGKPVTGIIGAETTGEAIPIAVEPCSVCAATNAGEAHADLEPEDGEGPEEIEVEVDLVINREDRQVVRLTAK